MIKITNIFLFILVIIFFLSIYKFYASSKNIDAKSYTRNNINEIINTKIKDLPVLENDTDKIIEFNDGYSIKKKVKPRSFWNLLKTK